MRYENGGRVQVYMKDGKEVRVGPRATDEEIIAAFAAGTSEETKG
jgi:hypothetical protein